MFKANYKQSFSARHLNQSNRAIFRRNSTKLQEQLLVLKQVNNLILGRKNDSQEVVTKNYFGRIY